MVQIKIKGDKNRYDVLNRECIGCKCLALGEYQHRGATLSGLRNTGAYSACCMNRAYHGCPENKGYSKELVKERRKNGYHNI